MIYTSYFTKLNRLSPDITPISIAISPPTFYKGKDYPPLIPPFSILHAYKRNRNEEEYTEKYTECVLDKLDPNQVVRELYNMVSTRDICFLCYERSESFCHRHLVANWLTSYGHGVIEIEGRYKK